MALGPPEKVLYRLSTSAFEASVVVLEYNTIAPVRIFNSKIRQV
jgi:hypothetical protein